MHHFVEAITDTKGNALIGYFVRCVDAVTGVGASLYADTSLTPILSISGVANAAQVDSDGNADFYIAGGTYHLDIYATDSTSFVRRIPNIEMIDTAVAAGKVASRTLLASVVAANGDCRDLIEAGREGTFVFSSANLSTKVTADPNQGLFVAPSSDTTGASGAWVRKFTGLPAHINWWGFTADYNGTTGTDNLAVVNAAMVALQAVTPAETEVGAVWFEGRSLSFRDAGRGSMSGPMSIKTTLTEIDFTGCELIFPADSFGIIINTDTTDGESTRTSGPFPYRIRLIKPKLRGHNGTDRTKHGIWMRTVATIIDPDIQNFSGDVIRIGNSNGHTAGNQNGWLVLNPFGQECGGDGIRAEGADASAGLCLNYNITLCGRFAAVDLSANGNKWNGQSAFCGVLLSGVNTVPAFVYHAGTGHNWAIIAGQEANTTVTPSTSRPDVWIDCGAGTGTDPAIPNWTSGITMEAGGSVRSLGGTGNAQFDHCYFETGSFSCWQLNTSSVIRDFTGSNLGIGGTVEYANNSGLVNYSSYTVQNTDNTGTSSVLLGGTVDHFALWESAAGGNAVWHWQYTGGYLRMRDGGGHDSIAINPTTGRWYIIDTEAHYRVNGIQVVGAQQSAIADDASGAANQAKLNAILAALRTHGLIAT